MVFPSDYSVCDPSLSTGAWGTEPKSSSLLSLIGCGGRDIPVASLHSLGFGIMAVQPASAGGLVYV